MSDYRDSLPDDATRARFDAACLEAGRVLAYAIADLEAAARAGDPDAIARCERMRARRRETEAAGPIGEVPADRSVTA